MIRMVLTWIGSPWAFELAPGLNKLGRNPTNDFRVSDPSVSSFHAELSVTGEDIRVRDLRSTNGTFIDEVRVEEGQLTPNNILRLGNIRFKLEEVTVTPSPKAPLLETPSLTELELKPSCLYHTDLYAAYKCENCGSALCANCVTVVGQGKYDATTVCPVCRGQCYPLPHHPEAQQRPSFFRRLTQTLRLSSHDKAGQA